MTNGEETKKSPWPKIIGCGCLLIVLIVGGCIGGTWYFAKSRFGGAYENPMEKTMGMLTDESQKSAIKGKTDQIRTYQVEMAEFSLGAMFWGWDLAITADGTVTDEELQALHTALDELIRVEGRIDQADQGLLQPDQPK